MASRSRSAEEYRAIALLCRQQAACDPDKSWQLLGEAERWEYLAAEQSASDLKARNFPQSRARYGGLAHPVGIGNHSGGAGDDGTCRMAAR
jgi:hypothetical protein